MLIVDTKAKWKKLISQRPYPKTICIDHNGVADQYQGWKGKDEWAPPAEEVEWFYQQLIVRQFRLVCHTAIETLDVLVDWYEHYNLARYMYAASFMKIPAVCYVDDRAVYHDGNFHHTLDRVDNFGCHWETPELKVANIDFTPVNYDNTGRLMEDTQPATSRYLHKCSMTGLKHYLEVSTVPLTESSGYIRLAYCRGCDSYPYISIDRV